MLLTYHGRERRRGVRAAIDLEPDTRIEMNAVKDAPQRRCRRLKTESVSSGRASEHQREAGSAALEVLQGLPTGDSRIRVVQTLDHLPGRSGFSPEQGLCLCVTGIERLNPQRVIGLGDEFAIERRALEHPVYQLAPLLA